MSSRILSLRHSKITSMSDNFIHLEIRASIMLKDRHSKQYPGMARRSYRCHDVMKWMLSCLSLGIVANREIQFQECVAHRIQVAETIVLSIPQFSATMFAVL